MKNVGFMLFGNNDGEFLMKCESSSLMCLANSTAAFILDFCEKNPKPYLLEKTHNKGVMQHLKASHCAPHFWDNVALSQVKLLYSIVQYCVATAGPMPFFFSSPDTCEYLLSALSNFQQWKTEHCANQQKEHGENWGTETWFFKMKWDDLNDEFRKAYHA